MDFKLNETQLSFKEMFKDFADKELRPNAAAIDLGDTELYLKLTRKMHDCGFSGLAIPEEYGGSNQGYFIYALAVEELCKGCTALGKHISGQTNMCFPIIKYGTEEQKQKYVAAWVEGTKRASFVITEPNAGSDAASMTTTGVYDGDDIVLNGTKTFITGADHADYFITFYKQITEDGEQKPGCVIIDAGTPGLNIGRPEKLMGMHGNSVCEVNLDNCRVPKSNFVGKVGQGFHVAMAALDAGRLGVSAICVGTAQEAIDQTVQYTQQRIQFGKRISQFQNTQFKLAELQTRVNAARLLVYNAACSLDAGEPSSHLCSMAKYFASDVLNDVARQCLQLHGGYGYSMEYPIERIYRDAKITEIFEGTSEVQKMVIAKWMGVK